MDVSPRLAALRRYFADDPDNLALGCEIAELATQAGEYVQAETVLNGLLQSRSGEPRVLFELGALKLAQGDWSAALSVYDDLLERGVDNAGVRCNRTYALLALRRPQEAIESVSDIEDEPAARTLMARAWHQLGDCKKAAEMLENVHSREPDSAEVLGWLALARLDGNEFERARHAAQMALSINPEQPQALLVMAMGSANALAVKEAEGYSRKLLSVQPDNGAAWSALGRTLLVAGRLDEADEALEKAVHFMPEHVGTWHLLGWCELAQDRLDAAYETFQKAAEIDRNFGETYGAMAVVEILQRKGDCGDNNMKVARRLDPNGYALALANALKLREQGKDEESDALVQQVLARDSGLGGASLAQVIDSYAQKMRSEYADRDQSPSGPQGDKASQ